MTKVWATFALLLFGACCWVLLCITDQKMKTPTTPTAAAAIDGTEVALPNGAHIGHLYYFRDDANRRCFALFDGNTHGGSIAMTPISCEDVSWR